MTTTIIVKLEGKNVHIQPLTCDMEPGSHKIQWILEDESRRCDFAEPPITFIDKDAPFIRLSRDGKTATCTDANENNSGTLISYRYQVHLISSTGSFTYPSRDDPKSSGDPYIRNRPK